ncbi:hypothetical protein B0H10DRAFT_2191073 [Mycena sp. CBHHK59/15]|nr:hypothetical protein B0H10DRAFT_2191073 [Mycena sp. CBHHK59/15]
MHKMGGLYKMKQKTEATMQATMQVYLEANGVQGGPKFTKDIMVIASETCLLGSAGIWQNGPKMDRIYTTWPDIAGHKISVLKPKIAAWWEHSVCFNFGQEVWTGPIPKRWLIRAQNGNPWHSIKKNIVTPDVGMVAGRSRKAQQQIFSPFYKLPVLK